MMKVLCNSFYITVIHDAYGLLFINSNEVQIKWQLTAYQRVSLNSWILFTLYIFQLLTGFLILNIFEGFIHVI